MMKFYYPVNKNIFNQTTKEESKNIIDCSEDSIINFNNPNKRNKSNQDLKFTAKVMVIYL